MINFLEETLECLQEHGRTEADVLWVGKGYSGDKRYKTTWEDFKKNADFDYNNGYGCNKIHMDLKIVGKDFWMERGEYDGSEWWNFKVFPVEPTETKQFVPSDLYH